MTPILLQRGPEFLKYLDELLILVFMIAGALLPAIKQSREKKKLEERRRRANEGGRPDARAEAREGDARRSDLEERVRTYFEERTPPRPTAQRPPPPPPPPSVVRPSPPPERLSLGFRDVHIDLKDIEHLSSVSRADPLARRAGARRLRSANRPLLARRLRKSLRDPMSIRQAIVLKEILGVPKGLEGIGGGGRQEPGGR